MIYNFPQGLNDRPFWIFSLSITAVSQDPSKATESMAALPLRGCTFIPPVPCQLAKLKSKHMSEYQLGIPNRSHHFKITGCVQMFNTTTLFDVTWYRCMDNINTFKDPSLQLNLAYFL